MKTCKYKIGFTLVEMLTVIAVVAVLATLMVGVALRIETREKQKHCTSTLALLSTALAQFHEYGFDYKGDYTAFNFPLDCNGFDKGQIEDALEDALDTGDDSVVVSSVVDPNDSSNEIMYLLLSMVPASRETLEKIDRKLVTNIGLDEQPMQITIGSGESAQIYPLFRVLDPWGTTLIYDYYDEDDSTPDPDEARTFPLITSAGPDKEFGTDDDITNR